MATSNYHCDSCRRSGPVDECRIEQRRSDDVRVLKVYRCPSCQTIVKGELAPLCKTAQAEPSTWLLPGVTLADVLWPAAIAIAGLALAYFLLPAR